MYGWDDFNAIVAKQDGDSLASEIFEACYSERNGNSGIFGRATCTSLTKIDQLNFLASGSVEYNGIDYYFEVRDGNCNGSEMLLFCLDSDPVVSTIDNYQPPRYTFAPSTENINKAISDGEESFLLKKWDLMISNGQASELVRKYSYDRFFSPTLIIESHYRKEFEKMGIQYVTEEESEEIRKNLNKRGLIDETSKDKWGSKYP